MNIKKFKVNQKEVDKIYEQYSVKYILNYYFFGYNDHMNLIRKFKAGKLHPATFIKYWNKKLIKKTSKAFK